MKCKSKRAEQVTHKSHVKKMKSSCAAHASKQLLREQGSVPPNLAHHRPARWIQPLGPSKNIPMTFLGSCPCGAAGVMG